MNNPTIPKLVRLIQCGRRSCSYVLAEEERHWREDPEWEDHKTAICPLCGEDSFYHLKANGQKISFRERDQYRDGVPLDEIEATPRMGPKMRNALRDAKTRAFARFTKEDQP